MPEVLNSINLKHFAKGGEIGIYHKLTSKKNFCKMESTPCEGDSAGYGIVAHQLELIQEPQSGR